MNRLLRLIGRRYPIYLIGIPGLLMLTAGLALGAVITTNRVLSVHVVSVGRMVASVSLCLAGAMSVLASIVLSTVGRLELEIESRTVVSEEEPGYTAVSTRQSGANWVPLVFGLPGFVALLGGLLLGGWALYSRFIRGALFHGTYIVSTAFCLAGLMLVLTGTILHALHDVLGEVQGVS